MQQRLLRALIDQGARSAKPGEFTLRAFLNRKLDLSQSEAVADLIASQSAAAHKLALQQLRGGYSEKIEVLRQQLIDFSALIELELNKSVEIPVYLDQAMIVDNIGIIKEVIAVFLQLIQENKIEKV